MNRFTQLIAGAVATVMTAVTFGVIGASAADSTAIPAAPVTQHLVSEALVGTKAVLRQVFVKHV